MRRKKKREIDIDAFLHIVKKKKKKKK